MNTRTEELNKLRFYTDEIDKDLTMILQSLQWDRKHILQHPAMVSCKFDSNHKVSLDNIDMHEQDCLHRINGYTKGDPFLPDPINGTSTLKKLSKEDIDNIIDTAASSDPTFKRVCINTFHGSKLLWLLCVDCLLRAFYHGNIEKHGTERRVGSGALEPQTLGRLQCAYSMDERRAIYDAVVSAAPSCHDLADLALPSVGDGDHTTKTKTRTEILAELRDMRRRRTKYRVATKSKNYSDVLRDVIKTQMEMYNDVLDEVETKPDVGELNASIGKQIQQERNDYIHPKGDNIVKQDDKREFNRCEGDRDSEKYTRKRADIDYRNQDDRDRRHKHRDRSRKESFDKRLSSHNRSIEGHRGNRDKSRDGHKDISRDRHRGRSRDRYRGRSKERGFGARQDGDYKGKEKHSVKYDVHTKEHKDGDRVRQNRRDRENNEQKDSDTERAKNLITEIKREIDLVDQSQGVTNGSDNYKTSVKVKHEMQYREYISDYNSHENNPSRSLDIANSHKDRRSGDHKRHKDKRESDVKEYRDKYERHKRSRRDNGYDKEGKKSHTVEKHRRYYEVYAELDSRKHKGNESNND